jgi:hypothetical protein
MVAKSTKYQTPDDSSILKYVPKLRSEIINLGGLNIEVVYNIKIIIACLK